MKLLKKDAQRIFLIFSSGEKREKKAHNPQFFEEIKKEIEKLRSKAQ
ncbi:hypothetical protein ACSFC1_03810 [Pseudothermotoga sp. U03pept]